MHLLPSVLLLGSMREADIGKLDITKDEFRDKYNARVEEGRLRNHIHYIP